MNIKYLAYNLIKTDYKKLNEFVNQLHIERNISKKTIYKDILINLFERNTMLLDYFYMKFYDNGTNKSAYTNVWDMHLFHRKFNGKESVVFRDKLQFRKRFKNYFSYAYFVLKSKNEIPLLSAWIKHNNYKKIVAKQPLSSAGEGVKIISIEFTNADLLIDGRESKSYLSDLYKKGYTLFESFIEQHIDLKQIYPNSVNTLRIITFLNKRNEIEIWATLLRLGLDKSVDNFSAGGLSANIDINSGIINSLVRLKDPFHKTGYDRHPVTGIKITGIQIPYWNEIIAMIKKAALEVPEVRTVGWDIAITPDGPTLIEGNDNWDKTHFELTSGIGLNERIKVLLRENEY